MTHGFDETEYKDLLMQFAPRPIESNADLPRVERRIWDLLALDARSPAQEAFLTILSSLVERWENENIDIPPLSGVELIRALLDDRELRQKALVPIFGTASIVSEVLSGKRVLQAKHIAELSRFFHVSPSAFFAAPQFANSPERSNVATPGSNPGGLARFRAAGPAQMSF